MNSKGYLRKIFNRRSINLYLKMFIVCIAISLFLTIIVGVFNHNYIMRQFDQEIEKFEKGQVEKTANTIRMMFQEFEKIGQNYALHPDFNQLAYLKRDEFFDDYYTVKKLMDILSSAINSSNYINDIFVYYENSNMILNFSAPLEEHIFYDMGWKEYYEQMTENSILINTRKLDNSVNSRSSSYKNNVISFLTTIPYDGEEKLGTIVINVDYCIVSNILKNIINDSESVAFLASGDGTVLSSNNDEYLYSNIKEIINSQSSSINQEPANTNMIFKGRKMVCYCSNVGINDWKLYIMIPSNIIFKKSLEIRLITILVLISILIIIAIASLLLSKKIYKPIKAIIMLLKSEAGLKSIDINDTSYTNYTNYTNSFNDISGINNACDNSDISVIKNGMNLLLKDKKSLEGLLDENRLLFREYFLINLITGKINDRKLIEKKAGYFNININYEYYQVAAIKNVSLYNADVDIEEYETKKLAMVNIVQKSFTEEKIDIICSQDIDDNILLLIKIHDGANKKRLDSLILKCFETIKKRIEYYLGYEIIAGIGRIYDDILKIELSYKESLKAIKYSFIAGDIVDICSINYSEDSESFYPLDMENKIISSIKLCDYEKVMLYVNRGVKEIIDNNRDIDHILMSFFNLINFVNRCIFEFGLKPKNIMQQENYNNISINNFKNIDEFMGWLELVFKKIVEHNIYMKEQAETDFSSKVKQYIEKNYMNNISLSSVSECFGYNSSYFSRLFKENLGVNFLDYMYQIRIEKAKILLATTNITIQEIAEQVGFTNRISFERCFKKFIEINPGEYRTKMRYT
ncbi:MAG TPA: helix-turn-helix domain-containing protein [Clostridiales bacterium]|nr:helix-turn-helix domain-containing protein [Clostridiales bacterium]